MSDEFKPKFRLRDKLLIWVMILIVLLVSLVLFFLNGQFRAIESDALDKALGNSLKVFRHILEEKRSNVSQRADLIADDPQIKSLLKNRHPKPEAVKTICRDILGSAGGLLLVADKGGSLAVDSLEPSPNSAAADWPYLKAALHGQNSEGFFVYPSQVRGSDGNYSWRAFLVAARPIHREGKVTGALLLGSSLDDNMAGQIKDMTNSELVIYLRHKVFGSTWNGETIPVLEKSLADHGDQGEAWMKYRTDSSSFPIVIGKDNYLALFEPVDGINGKDHGDFVVLRSLDEAMAAQRNLQQTVVVAGDIGMSFAFVMLFFIASHITGPLKRLIAGIREAAEGNFEHQVPVQTKDELGLLASAFNEMIRGLKEKERITNILGKYITPEVAKKVLEDKDGTALKGERRECAVLFTDIRGFTAMSENVAPEKIVADLNAYFTLMVDVIIKHQGTVDKFIGDSIMVVWGAPLQFEDREYRAVKAAMEMQLVLAIYNMGRRKNGLAPIYMGIGINTGVVVSGNLGSEKRTDYTVIGEEVNLASRLCARAEEGQILITEFTYRKIKGWVEVNALEPMTFKGFSEPVKVYEVLGIARNS